MLKDVMIGAAGTALVVLAFMLFSGLLTFVFLSYWTWFIVPLGIPKINFFHAYGILIMFNLIFPASKISGDEAGFMGTIKAKLIALILLWPFGFAISLLV